MRIDPARGLIREHQCGRVSIFALRGRLLTRWGGAGCDPTKPGAFSAPHDLCLDSRGDLYVAEVTWMQAVSIGLVPSDCLRSFPAPLPGGGAASPHCR